MFFLNPYREDKVKYIKSQVYLHNKNIAWSDKSKALVEFCKKTQNQYYMLLNRETYNFTLFNFHSSNNHTSLNTRKLIYDELKICLQNRGEVLSIELTEQEDAYEIWIRDDEQNILVYYFFPYDIGVIEWGVKNA